ncbi:MAG: glycosyltransferase family 2 protein [Planctomycetota bacterium]|nr:glycosyltransferase family 2 protein [Planctomycetota bacterium]
MSQLIVETSAPEAVSASVRISPPKIAAVVVTRNRLKLLQRLLGCLSRQTRKLDAIIVVDVNSDDGTTEFLRAAGEPIIPVYLTHNAGGAGGFHEGMKRAHEDGFDWLWAMDDDGFPDDTALEKITDRLDQTDAKWINSMVVETENPERLAWVLPYRDGFSEDLKALRALGPIVNGSSPFNGTLIHRSLIDAIGLPCKELFIWGDEMEFKRRAEGAGFRTVSITDSMFHHPAPPHGSVTTVPLKSFRKYYYKVRNSQAVADRNGKPALNYAEARAEGRNYIRTLLKDSVRVPLHNLIKISIIVRAIWAARRNDTRHFKL